MGKRADAVRKLAQDGWTVSEAGEVVRPDGTVRPTRLKVGKGGRTNYQTFNVKHGGISTPIPVHKLAAYHKFGEASFEQEVRHLDNCSTNNKPENIGLGSGSDNAMDRPVEERIRFARNAGIAGGKVRRKFGDSQICSIRSSPKGNRSLAKEHKQ